MQNIKYGEGSGFSCLFPCLSLPTYLPVCLSASLCSNLTLTSYLLSSCLLSPLLPVSDSPSLLVSTLPTYRPIFPSSGKATSTRLTNHLVVYITQQPITGKVAGAPVPTKQLPTCQFLIDYRPLDHRLVFTDAGSCLRTVEGVHYRAGSATVSCTFRRHRPVCVFH